ncbi:MAG: heavy metal translocating P-type ATPase [Sporomusaceae bacterium]|nr:heavy metal translocating P-type ATPase [Sporomusaceae bacterium]
MDNTLAVKTEQTLTSGVWERHGAAISAAICAVLSILAWSAGQFDTIVMLEIPLYLAAYGIGGYRKAWEGLQTLLQERELDVDLLMIVAAAGAASIGYWQDGAILIFIFSLSGALEGYTLEKTNNDIRSIMSLRPETALVVRGKDEVETKAEDLQTGDLILVKPGERIAADGVIREGFSAINQASITGESIPADKGQGDEVFAGTINGHGSLLIEVTKPAAATVLARIIQLVQEAKSEKTPSQLFVERFEGLYVKGVLTVALLLLLLPPFLWGWSWDMTIYRAMIFLVVASPCALVASIMPAVLAGISNAARKGILFKGGVHLENIGGIRAVAFDKTGTLTEGKPRVTDIISFGSYQQDNILRLAASLEALSEHPIAKAVVQAARERNLELASPGRFLALPGKGITGTVDGVELYIGSLASLERCSYSESDAAAIDRLVKAGKTIICLQAQERLQGILALQDTIRPRAKAAVRKLQEMGIAVVMLTGDAAAAAEPLGQDLGVDQVYAELLPQQKVEIVRQLSEQYRHVAMVGDGINDAPALAAASVGIAMGAAGTDVALETASVVLMADDLERVADAVILGRRTRRVVKQNVSFALGIVALLVAGTFLGNVNLPSGVIGHEGSTILVILNGLRLLK